MSLQRSISNWAQCSPEAMSQMSHAAVLFALRDAKADIVTLAKELARIAYPRRGTPEETQSIEDAAARIQKLITHEDAVNWL